ncbi:MAG: type II toxin-antitoxin system VapC family toxin [Pseudomonadota bacterium]
MPDQSEVFVDANIFVYHFSGPTEYTESCTRFLQRIEEGKLTGITSTLVIAETLHRLMIIEATSKLQIEPKAAVHYLKHHPLDVKKLTEHIKVPEQIFLLSVRIHPVEIEDILKCNEIKSEYGLLTNDALTLAVVRRYHFTNIATNDPDFERIPDLTVWKPSE